MREVKPGYLIGPLVAALVVIGQARADVELKLEVTATSMSTAAPELQVLIRNNGNEVGSYKLQIVGAKQGAVPVCDLRKAPPDDTQPGNA